MAIITQNLLHLVQEFFLVDQEDLEDLEAPKEEKWIWNKEKAIYV